MTNTPEFIRGQLQVHFSSIFHHLRAIKLCYRELALVDKDNIYKPPDMVIDNIMIGLAAIAPPEDEIEPVGIRPNKIR